MGIWDNISDIGGSIYHRVTGTPSADEVRNERYAMNDQIKAYKDATALSQQQLAETRNEQAAEKRKINEKQIRALRNNYRPAGGFLNNQTTSIAGSNLNSKLGG